MRVTVLERTINERKEKRLCAKNLLLQDRGKYLVGFFNDLLLLFQVLKVKTHIKEVNVILYLQIYITVLLFVKSDAQIYRHW